MTFSLRAGNGGTAPTRAGAGFSRHGAEKPPGKENRMGESIIALLVALIGALGSFGGVYLSNKKSQALIAYRLEQLERKVDRHNSLVERTYVLEGRMNAAENLIEDMKGRAA